MPNSTFVQDATVSILQSYPRSSVILASNTSDSCLRYNESGWPRSQSESLRRFLRSLVAVPIVPGPSMHKLLRSRLLSMLPKPPAWCVDVAEDGSEPAFGVLCRFTTMQDESTGSTKLVGLIINMRAEAVSVAVLRSIDGMAAMAAVELRTGVPLALGSAGKLLSAGQVLVLELK